MTLPYQRRLQYVLFMGAALAFPIFGLLNFIQYLVTPEWPFWLQGSGFIIGAFCLWVASRWLSTNRYQKAGEWLGLFTFLWVTTAFCLTTPRELPLIGVVGFAITLLCSALSDSPHKVLFWCVTSILAYWAALSVRQLIPSLVLAYETTTLLALYVIPALVFIFFSLVGIDVAQRLRVSVAQSAVLKLDLQTSEWQYQQLLQTMNEGFAIVDEHEVFVYVNDRFCEILGYSQQELLNHRNDEVLLYDETNLAVLRLETAKRAQKQRSTYELSTRHKDGRPLTLLISAVPNFDAQGVFRGTMSVVMDISQRKQMEEALKSERALLSQHVEERTASLRLVNEALQRELVERQQTENALQSAEEQYRMLFNHAPIGIYRSSLDGRQLRANPALARLNGYSSEAEMLVNINDIAAEWYVNPGRRNEFKRILEEQGSVINFVSEVYRHKTRERIWISETAILVRDSEGKPLYYQGTVEDITSRKQNEQEQEQLIAQLAQAVRLKDEFLASMSHELRTPLNSILGITEALQDDVYGSVVERQRKALAMIAVSGQHLLALINDILDLAKIEAGEVELVYDRVDVNALCQATLQVLNTAATKKHIQVLFQPDEHVTTLQADERRLKQILLNLLDNALKFTPEGGQVGLEISGDKTQGAVQFTIWDTGVGIEQAAMPRLFKPFIQLDSRLGRQHEGTGLGLALVYRMVELHGGSVAVESEPGQGSRFWVRLPWIESSQALAAVSKTEMSSAPQPTILASEPEATAAPPAPPTVETAHSQSGPLILLAEDNLRTAQTMANYLRLKNFRVELATDGVQALAKARTQLPDLILMDLQMPNMDGLEATIRMRADERFKQIPIVAFTALTMPGDCERSLASGVDAYLSKPIGLNRLLDLVTFHLDPA
ncbi:MAG: PAS domain S-box protein [Caldilineaceae bacterium]